MSKAFYTTIKATIVVLSLLLFAAAPAMEAQEEQIVITADTLTADNRKNTVMFEGSVVAEGENVTISADRMGVSFDNAARQVKRIHASGNVKVNNEHRVIFSDEAVYFGEEEKIVFTGQPKAVDGENVITGREIIYYLKEERTVVKGSRLVLKNHKE